METKNRYLRADQVDFAYVQKPYLRSSVRSLNLRGIEINPKFTNRRAEDIEKSLTYALSGIIDVAVATAISAGVKKDKKNTPEILPLLVVPTPEGSGFLVDDETQTLWTDSFWICENNRFKYINPSRPVQIDGVDLTVDHRTDKTLDLHTANAETLDLFTEDKNYIRNVLQRANIKVPRGIFLDDANPNILDTINQFIRENPDINEVVFKENFGSCGNGVVMFNLYDPTPLLTPRDILDFVEGGKNFLLEERVIPPNVPELQSLVFGDQVDFNFRVLTTLDRNSPEVVDAEIRFQEKNSSGVNISLQVKAARCSILKDQEMVKKVFDVAKNATKAVFREVLPESDSLPGVAGIDLIYDQNREIYVMEVNGTRAGGFGTLCRLDRKPLNSIKDILIPSSKKFLSERAAKRIEYPGNLRRLPFNRTDNHALYNCFVFRGMNYQAENWLLNAEPEFMNLDTKIGVLIYYAQLFNDYYKVKNYVDIQLEQMKEGFFKERLVAIQNAINERYNDQLYFQGAATLNC